MKHPLCEPLSCPGVKKIGTAGLQGLGFLIPGTSPKSGFGAHVTMLLSYVRVVLSCCVFYRKMAPPGVTPGSRHQAMQRSLFGHVPQLLHDNVLVELVRQNALFAIFSSS